MISDEHLRLADLLAALSMVTDLGMGHGREEAVRACVVATRLGERMGLPEGDLADVYYATLLRHIGCTASPHEIALAYGDDVAINRAAERADVRNPRDVLELIGVAAAGGGPLQRVRMAARFAVRGKRLGTLMLQQTCEVGARTARRLGLPAAVQRALFEVGEEWDGKGFPQGLAGEAISVTARLSLVAFQVTVFDGVGGSSAAMEAVRKRSGTMLDPAMADAFLRDGTAILGEMEAGDVWTAALETEPKPWRMVGISEIDTTLRVFADMVDLKTPFTFGHSTGVATLAEGAARELGLSAEEVTTVRRAGLAHDFGRVGFPTRSRTSRARSRPQSGRSSGCTPTTPNGSSGGATRWPRSPR